MLSEGSSKENNVDLPLLFPTLRYSGRFRDGDKTSKSRAHALIRRLTLADILTTIRKRRVASASKHRSTRRKSFPFRSRCNRSRSLTVTVPVPVSITVTIHQRPSLLPFRISPLPFPCHHPFVSVLQLFQLVSPQRRDDVGLDSTKFQKRTDDWTIGSHGMIDRPSTSRRRRTNCHTCSPADRLLVQLSAESSSRELKLPTVKYH